MLLSSLHVDGESPLSRTVIFHWFFIGAEIDVSSVLASLSHQHLMGIYIGSAPHH